MVVSRRFYEAVNKLRKCNLYLTLKNIFKGRQAAVGRLCRLAGRRDLQQTIRVCTRQQQEHAETDEFEAR